MKEKILHQNKSADERGFSIIETICATSIMLVALTAALSAITYGVVYMYEAGLRSQARSIAASTIESIFAARDITANNVSNWDSINNTTISPGIFQIGWKPTRRSPGRDGVYGTADDTCTVGETSCGGITNEVFPAFERSIMIEDIPPNNPGNPVTKRRINVAVRFRIGSLIRTERVSTIIANLPLQAN